MISGTLYQWSTGQKVKVVPQNGENVCEVHFARQGDPTAIVVETKYTEEGITAEIPNILLQSSKPILAYAVEKNEDAEKCFCNCTLFVRARPKPDDYVYTETEAKSFDDHEERIAELNDRVTRIEENGSGGTGATPEQLAQIEKNKNDISQLFSEIENLKNSENYVDDDGYIVLGSSTTIDADGYINL